MSHSTARRIVTVAEAAERYGVCTKTVRRWIAEGRIPSHRIGPRLIRVDLDELDAVLTSPNVVVPTSEPTASREDILHMVDAAPDLTSAQKDIIRAVLGGVPVAESKS